MIDMSLQCMGVLLPAGDGVDFTPTPTTSLFTQQLSDPLPQGRVVAVAPAITHLSGEGLSHYNAITHSFHPHRNPASQSASVPSPSPSPSPSPPCFPPYFCHACPHPASPSLLHMTQIHPSLTPLTPSHNSLSYLNPPFTLFVGFQKHTKEQG